MVKKGQNMRSGTSKKYSDPIQFVLKHDSILSNRTSDTMLPKVGKLPLSAPFQNIPLSSLDKLIEGLVKHIEFQIEIILDKRGNFQEANHQQLVKSYSKAMEAIIDCYGLGKRSSQRLTTNQLHDPMSAETCLILYIMQMEPYFMRDIISCKLQQGQMMQQTQNLENFGRALMEVLSNAESSRVDKVMP